MPKYRRAGRVLFADDRYRRVWVEHPPKDTREGAARTRVHEDKQPDYRMKPNTRSVRRAIKRR